MALSHPCLSRSERSGYSYQSSQSSGYTTPKEQPKTCQLMTAVLVNDTKGAGRLLKERVSANLQWKRDGNTLLHIAVENSNKQMTQLLLDSQADPNVRNQKGETPLHIANNLFFLRPSKKKIIENLLDARADPNIEAGGS